MPRRELRFSPEGARSPFALTEEQLAAIERHIGDRIRTHRIRKGLSQPDVSGVLGISYQQLQKYERGQSRVAASRLFQIAAMVGVASLDQFFEGVRPWSGIEGPAAGDELSAEADAEKEALLTAFAALPSRERRLQALETLLALGSAPEGGAVPRLDRGSDRGRGKGDGEV